MNTSHYGDRILTDLHKTLEVCLKYGDEVLSDDCNKEKFNEMAKTVCKFEHTFLLGHDIVKEAAKETTVEAFDQVLEDHRKQSNPKFKPQDSKRYTDFVKKTQRLIDTQQAEASQSSQPSGNLNVSLDNDSSQPVERIPDIDPITKKRLEHPVRNKHCNHIYGYESVLQLLQQNSRLRCPIVGCPNKRPVQMADLIEDEEMTNRLAMQR